MPKAGPLNYLKYANTKAGPLNYLRLFCICVLTQGVHIKTYLFVHKYTHLCQYPYLTRSTQALILIHMGMHNAQCARAKYRCPCRNARASQARPRIKYKM